MSPLGIKTPTGVLIHLRVKHLNSRDLPESFTNRAIEVGNKLGKLMVYLRMTRAESQGLWCDDGWVRGVETVRWLRNGTGHKRKPITRMGFLSGTILAKLNYLDAIAFPIQGRRNRVLAWPLQTVLRYGASYTPLLLQHYSCRQLYPSQDNPNMEPTHAG
jgi:hypothetical protein